MDSNELAAIYRAHNAMVERQAMRILRDAQMAEDVAQEVFLSLIKYSAHTPIRDITGLLYQMATQRAVKRLRAEQQAQSFHAHVPQAHGAPTDVDAWIMFKRVLAACDEVRAQIAVHYFVDGMTHSEIEALLHIPRREVGRHLERFCTKARKMAKPFDPVLPTHREG